MKCPLPGCGGNLGDHVSEEAGKLSYICDACCGVTMLYRSEIESAAAKCREQDKFPCRMCGYWHHPGISCPTSLRCLHTLAQGYVTCEKCNTVTSRDDTHNCPYATKAPLLPKTSDRFVSKQARVTKNTFGSSLVVAFNGDGSVTVTPNFD